MADKKRRVNYHYGFYAAMKVEYDMMGAPVSYDQEKQLGEEPIRLDFLIIKKDPEAVLNDHIGEFFRPVNLFEYKSPRDGLSIDDFYKAQGYGLIYKSFGRRVNELPIRDITLTLVRHTMPRELIRELKSEGFNIRNPYYGIYRFEGNASIPTQLVVTSQLPKGEYDGLQLLTGGVSSDDLISYAESAVATGDVNVITNLQTVIGVCLEANRALSEQIKEGRSMDDIIMEVFKDVFDEAKTSAMKEGLAQGLKQGREQGLVQGREQGLAQGLEQGREQGLVQGREQGLVQGREQGLVQGREQGMEQGMKKGVESSAENMIKDNVPAGNISKWTGLSIERLAAIAERVGVALC